MYMWQETQDWMRKNIDEYAAMNPGWEIRFIEDVPINFPAESEALLLREAPTPRLRADLVRYWLMWQQGGVYCDIDTRPIKPLDQLLDKIGDARAFYSQFPNSNIPDNFLIGGSPNHPFWENAFLHAQDTTNWKMPEICFGAYNAYLNTDDYDDVVSLGRLDTQEVNDIREYNEMRQVPREPLVNEFSFIKHYRIGGRLTIPSIDEIDDAVRRDPDLFL